MDTQTRVAACQAAGQVLDGAVTILQGTSEDHQSAMWPTVLVLLTASHDVIGLVMNSQLTQPPARPATPPTARR